MTKHWQKIFLALIIFLPTACSGSSFVEQERILVWHSWSDEAEAGLQALIDDFTSLNPDVRVIVTRLDTESLLYERYVEQAELGLGPDLLIGPGEWVRPLADAGLIQNLNDQMFDTSNLLSAAVDTLRYQPADESEAGLFGIPLTLETTVMIYNKSMVTDTPRTLDDLLLQAENGQKVALNSSFDSAFWGVQAFGGDLFDEEGRVTLDKGGFANWLNWLKAAQSETNIILEDHQPTLETLFIDGEVAYVAGDMDTLSTLQAALGEDAVGTAPLPSGPSLPAGPFLRTQATMLNAHSSATQSALALQLAQFLAQFSQQTALLRQTGLAPANNNVHVDPQVYPIVASFVIQSKTAVPYLNLPQMDTVQSDGDEVYLQTLTGEAEPNEAAITFTENINEMYGFESVVVLAEEEACQLSGHLEIWHRWPDTAVSDALKLLADEFAQSCPNVSITLTGWESDALRQQYQAVGGQAVGSDLILAPSNWMPDWVSQELIANLSGVIEPDTLQQYNTVAANSMQVDHDLYGIPLWLNLVALYYRADQVSDLPDFIDGLFMQTSPDLPGLLPVDVAHSVWTATAFGALTHDETYQLQIDPANAVTWLQWLQRTNDFSGITLSMDSDELKEMFKAGQAGYYVGEAMELTELQLALDSTVLQVAPLPPGPAGDAYPQLITEGLMINPAVLTDSDTLMLALAFADALSSQYGQNQLVEQANLVPSNINVNTTDYPAIAGFLQQAKTADFWWADFTDDQETGGILNTMIERAVFAGEDATEVVNSMIDELEALEETSP